MSSLDSSVCGSTTSSPEYECDGNVCRIKTPINPECKDPDCEYNKVKDVNCPENLRVLGGPRALLDLRYSSISSIDSRIHAEAFRDGQGAQHLIINNKEYNHPEPINCLRVDKGRVYINFSDKPFLHFI